MRFVLAVASLAGVLAWTSSASAQLGSTSRTGTTGASGRSLTQTGQVLGAQDFGGAGSGNLLRSATIGGMMGMNNANAMMGMNAMGMGMGRMGMGGMGMGMGGMGMGMGGMQGQGNQPALKIPIKLGFTPRTTFANATPVRATRFERRITKLSGVTTGSDLQVEVRAGVATLRGTVPTDRDLEMVEQLALLEPGIDSVVNELTVAPPPEGENVEGTELPRAR